MKWFKDIRVTIALLALVIGGAGLGVAIWDHLWATHEYHEITEPHTRFDEIRDKLIMLDNRLSERETWIETAENAGEDRKQDRVYLQQAQLLRSQAEVAWVNSDFDEAERLINEAYDVSDEIPPFYVLQWYWWLVIALVVAAVLVAVSAALISVRRRRYKEAPEEPTLSEKEK